MAEHAWHKKVREEVFSKYDPEFAYQSHSNISKLFLFSVAAGKRPRRIDCLSDADIVVTEPLSGRVVKIIEIESALNPKKILGIVLATHLCNKCSIRRSRLEPKRYLDMDEIELEIVFRKAPPGSQKDLKLDVIKPYIKGLISNTNGCLSKSKDIIFTPHE